MKHFATLLAAASLLAAPATTMAADKGSSGRQAQAKGTQEIPHCTKRLGTIAIVEPDNQWWRELNLGSPEAILKVFVQQSGCFGLVNRGRAMQSRAMERAMADSGELQSGSNLGKGQVKAADYYLEPDIVSSNKNSGGNSLGGVLGGIGGGLFGRGFGAIAGGINVKKSEANVTLSIVNARTTEEEALVEGYARKSDLSWGGGAGGLWSQQSKLNPSQAPEPGVLEVRWPAARSGAACAGCAAEQTSELRLVRACSLRRMAVPAARCAGIHRSMLVLFRAGRHHSAGLDRARLPAAGGAGGPGRLPAPAGVCAAGEAGCPARCCRCPRSLQSSTFPGRACGLRSVAAR